MLAIDPNAEPIVPVEGSRLVTPPSDGGSIKAIFITFCSSEPVVVAIMLASHTKSGLLLIPTLDSSAGGSLVGGSANGLGSNGVGD
jgi:hypothetical protein